MLLWSNKEPMQSFVYFVLVSLLFSDKAMVRNVILAAYLKKFSIVAINLKTLLSKYLRGALRYQKFDYTFHAKRPVHGAL